MALSSLESLLSQKKINPEEIVKREVISERLGKIEVSFKRLTYSEYKIFKNGAVNRKKDSSTFDADKYRLSILLNCFVDPNFNRVEFHNALGVTDGNQAIMAVFLPGEIVALADMILVESGFSEDPFREELPDGESDSE